MPSTQPPSHYSILVKTYLKGLYLIAEGSDALLSMHQATLSSSQLPATRPQGRAEGTKFLLGAVQS